MDNLLIRNIAVLGAEGCGKTTFVEAIHEITGGDSSWQIFNNKTDLSAVTVFHKNYKLNLLFVPGNEGCMKEAMAALHVVKGAILMIDALTGVDELTVKYYAMLKKRSIPTLMYINRMDKEGVDFDKLYKEIKSKLGRNTIPFCYPMGHKNDFDGFINCVTLKARKFNGVECVDAPVYPEKRVKAFELHNKMIETVVSHNQELMDKIFDGGSLTREDVNAALRKGVLDGVLVPVIVGSAKKKIGLHTTLNMLIDFLPNPSELKPIKGFDKNNKAVKRYTTNDEAFSAFVFKTVVFEGKKLIVFKVNSGYIKNNTEVYIPNLMKTITIKQLHTIEGMKATPVPVLFAGDIGCIIDEKCVDASMTLCDLDKVITYSGIE